MTDIWAEAVSRIANAGASELMGTDHLESISNSESALNLARAMEQTSLTFKPLAGGQANWMFGEALNSEVDADWIYSSDRGKAGIGIYLRFPVNLNEKGFDLYLTSLGHEDQYSNSYGLCTAANAWLEGADILTLQKRGIFRKLELTFSGFMSGATLKPDNLPATLSGVSGACEYVGGLLSQYAAQAAFYHYLYGSARILSEYDQMLAGLVQSWELGIAALRDLEFN